MSKVKGQMQVVERAAQATKKQISDVGNPKSVYNLNKALEDTEKELDIVQRKLKLDPKNIDLAAKEAKLLSHQFKLCEDRVEALRKEQQSLGKEKIGTQEWKNLSHQIGEAEIKAKQTSNAMKGLGKSTKDVSKEALSVSAVFKGGMWLEVAKKGFEMLGSAVSYVVDQLKKVATYMADATKEAAEYGDKISRLSSKTGIDTGTLQRLNTVSKLTKVELDDISKSMQKMMVNMGKADENGKKVAKSNAKVAESGKGANKEVTGAAKAFKTLGINLKEADGSFRNQTTVFWETVNALSGIEDKTQRAVYANAIFGKSYTNINGLIKMNSEELQKALGVADEMNTVLGDDTIQTLRGVEDEYKKFDIATSSFKLLLGAALAPAAKAFMGHAVEIVQSVGKIVKAITQDGNVDEAIAEFEGKIKKATDKFDELAPKIRQTIEKLKPVLNALVKEFAKIIQDIIDLFFSSGIADALAEAGAKWGQLFAQAVGRQILRNLNDFFRTLSGDQMVAQWKESHSNPNSLNKSAKSYSGMLPSYSVKSFNFPKNTVTKSTTNSFNINITGGVTTSASELVREIERQIVRRVSV
jgi:hypothetical protein